MENERLAIAERVKGLRDASDVTEREVAEKLGIPLDEYMEYEKGERDVPMSTIATLSAFYKVDPTAILTGGDTHTDVFHVTRAGTGPVVERRNVYHYEALGARFRGKRMDPFVVTVSPDLPQLHLNTHPGQEFNYVLSGRLRLTVDGNTLVLERGDSIYFNAEKPHGMRAEGGEPATFLAVITA